MLKGVNKYYLIIAGLIILLLTGCTTTGQSKDTPSLASGEDKVIYTIADDVGDWGFPAPYTHYLRGPGYIRMSLIFETLVWKDAEGLVGNLAEEWSYDDNEVSYAFKLRENIFWHDGEKFTAGDVLFTYHYAMEHPYAWADLSIVDRLELVDENRVKIYLTEPFAPFLENIAGTLPIIPEHIYSDIGDPAEFTDKKVATGTGPFKLVDYNRELGNYQYEANNDYYLGEPVVDEIRFVKIGLQMIPASVLNGSVNMAAIPAEMVDEFIDKGYNLLSGDHSIVTRLMFNHREEPFADPDFRRAVAYAIDRQSLVNIAQRGNALIGSPGLLPADNPWHSDGVVQYSYDPERAKRFFESTGYNGTEVSLLTMAEASRDAELIKIDLEKVGLTVNIESYDDKTVDSKIENWDFQMALNIHGGLNGDPQNLNKFILNNDFNSARFYEDKALTDLLADQLTIMDRQKRLEVVASIQDIYADLLPDLALYYPDSPYAHDGQINLYFTPGGIAIGVPIPVNRLAFVDYSDLS